MKIYLDKFREIVVEIKESENLIGEYFKLQITQNKDRMSHLYNVTVKIVIINEM